MLAGRGVTVFVAGLAMWLASRLLGSPGLEVIAIGIAALPLLAALAAKKGARRILVRRRLSDVRVKPGARVMVTLDVENRSPIPTSFLLLEERRHRHLDAERRRQQLFQHAGHAFQVVPRRAQLVAGLHGGGQIGANNTSFGMVGGVKPNLILVAVVLVLPFAIAGAVASPAGPKVRTGPVSWPNRPR